MVYVALKSAKVNDLFDLCHRESVCIYEVTKKRKEKVKIFLL